MNHLWLTTDDPLAEAILGRFESTLLLGTAV